jgi:hypothetical protein
MDLGGPQTVKVLSPEISYLLESAQVLCFTEGNTLRCDTRRVAWGHPGSKAGSRLTRCCDGNQGDPTCSSMRSMPTRAEEASQADGALEVGSLRSTCEAW